MTRAPIPDTPDMLETTSIPKPDIAPSRWANVSWIWVVPFITALLALGLFIYSVANSGPTITVRFQTAEGLEPGVTKVKYKAVEVGEVTSVRLSEDLSQVLAQIELNKAAQKFAVQGSRFWVVRPRIAATGVSGLNTLLSGAYIGVEAGNSNIVRKKFVGLEMPPIVAGDQEGHQFILHSDTLGSLEQGSPVFYRRIRVGQVVRYDLDKDGAGVTVHIFVNAPYDRYVNTHTRFWHASGVEFLLDSGGLKLNTQSLASLVAGGIAFQTAQTEGVEKAIAPALDGAAFQLAANANEAMDAAGGPVVHSTLYFDQSVKGLSVGAPIDFRGLPLGQVRSTRVDFDARKRVFRMAVDVVLYAEQLEQLARAMCLSLDCNSAYKPKGASSAEQALTLLVEQGLRAQLQVGNMFLSSLYIALDFLPTSAASSNTSKTGQVLKSTVYPAKQLSLEIPTLPSEINSLQHSASTLLAHLNSIPFDQIGSTLQHTLTQANSILGHIDTQLTPQAIRTLESLERTLEQAKANLESDSPLQADIHRSLTEFSRAMQSLNTFTEYLARHPDALLRGQIKEKGEE